MRKSVSNRRRLFVRQSAQHARRATCPYQAIPSPAIGPHFVRVPPTRSCNSNLTATSRLPTTTFHAMYSRIPESYLPPLSTRESALPSTREAHREHDTPPSNQAGIGTRQVYKPDTPNPRDARPAPQQKPLHHQPAATNNPSTHQSRDATPPGSLSRPPTGNHTPAAAPRETTHPPPLHIPLPLYMELPPLRVRRRALSRLNLPRHSPAYVDVRAHPQRCRDSARAVCRGLD